MRSHALGAVRSPAQWAGQQSTEVIRGAAGRAAVAVSAAASVSASPPSMATLGSVQRRAAR